jgi:peptidylprolyl isomerase
MRKALLCFAMVLVAACGNGREAQEAAPTTPAAAPTPRCTQATPAPPPAEEEPGKTKPDVRVPEGDPPCELVVQDIYAGTGDAVQPGDTVTIQYVGVSWSTGEQFDSSWERGEPATFPLGQLIRGWQEGIPGMKEGGRRRLIIPPDLGYGAQPPPGIPPNETLVFVIDLIEVER